MPVDPFARDHVDRSKPDVIVPVRRTGRRGTLEQLGEVGQQQRLMFVDNY